jgi:hypothetical protein
MNNRIVAGLAATLLAGAMVSATFVTSAEAQRRVILRPGGWHGGGGGMGGWHGSGRWGGGMGGWHGPGRWGGGWNGYRGWRGGRYGWNGYRGWGGGYHGGWGYWGGGAVAGLALGALATWPFYGGYGGYAGYGGYPYAYENDGCYDPYDCYAPPAYAAPRPVLRAVPYGDPNAAIAIHRFENRK